MCESVIVLKCNLNQRKNYGLWSEPDLDSDRLLAGQWEQVMFPL